MLQHSRQPLTSRQQRQLWQQRRRSHQTRRAMRKQQLLQQRAQQIQPQGRSRSTRERRVLTATARAPRSSRLPQRDVFAGQSSIRPAASRVTSSRVAPRHRPRVQSKHLGWFAYLTRLMIVGSGVAAITGTVLTIIAPERHLPQSQSQSQSVASSFSSASRTTSPLSTAKPGPESSASPKTFGPPANDVPTSLFYRWSQEPRFNRLIREGQELSQVEQQIRQWSASQTELKPALFFLNPETGDYIDINGAQSISAASTIKIPVLLAFFEEVDAGNIDLDESLVMRKDLVATEAGSMQYQTVGTQFSALETAEYMIAISDNTATNMLIDRLGGAEKLNQRFQAWGLKHTELRNPLPDLEGTNTVSPQDMAALMLKLTDETLLSSASREQALAILRQTVTNTLLPQGLEEDAQIAHKTGDIGSVVGDIGLIEMPNGQQYVAAILVQRPHNDPRAQELIRKISKLTYQTFRQQADSPSTSSTELGH